jgi:uncharacterized protein (TIGR02246 family)
MQKQVALAFALLIAGLISPVRSLAEETTEPEIFPTLPDYIVIGAPAAPEDEDAIRALMMDTARAWAAGDATGVARHYTSDAEWMNAFGDIRRGSDAIEDYLAWLFAGEDEGQGEADQAGGQMISLRYLGDDVAILHFMTKSTRSGALEGADVRHVHATSVLAKINGEWKTVHEHIADVRPRTTIK